MDCDWQVVQRSVHWLCVVLVLALYTGPPTAHQTVDWLTQTVSHYHWHYLPCCVMMTVRLLSPPHGPHRRLHRPHTDTTPVTLSTSSSPLHVRHTAHTSVYTDHTQTQHQWPCPPHHHHCMSVTRPTPASTQTTHRHNTSDPVHLIITTACQSSPPHSILTLLHKSPSETRRNCQMDKWCQRHNGCMTACLTERQDRWHNKNYKISNMTLSKYTASISTHLSIIYTLYTQHSQLITTHFVVYVSFINSQTDTQTCTAKSHTSS